MPPKLVRHISRCTIKPLLALQDPPPKRCNLTPWDLTVLFLQYIQKGLLFYTHSPSPNPEDLLHLLKQSLSRVLAHFYPLAGRLATEHGSSSSSSHVFIDCDGAGAEFIHAAADITVADVLTPLDVPEIVKSFFAFNGAVSHDGHSIPLLAIQVTQLVDGVFLGCSFNHVVGDGFSFWHFFNAWSEITKQGSDYISIPHPPITQRWFCDLDPSLIRLPFSNPNEFIERFAPPPLRERIFHFTSQSIAKLKAKANGENKSNNKISSFQALCALVWRSVTRARHLPPDQKTSCKLAIGNRTRLQPPLSPYYLGNCMQGTSAGATAGELLSHDLGWAAWLVHESVAGHTDAVVRETLNGWVKEPFMYQYSELDRCGLLVGSSPRFNMYGNDFGWGKPVAIRSGYANKYDGKVNSYPGVEGGGSVDLEICLLPESMKAFEVDEEFMDAVSHPP